MYVFSNTSVSPKFKGLMLVKNVCAFQLLPHFQLPPVSRQWLCLPLATWEPLIRASRTSLTASGYLLVAHPATCHRVTAEWGLPASGCSLLVRPSPCQLIWVDQHLHHPHVSYNKIESRGNNMSASNAFPFCPVFPGTTQCFARLTCRLCSKLGPFSLRLCRSFSRQCRGVAPSRLVNSDSLKCICQFFDCGTPRLCSTQ
jgi:hypothetical protein